MHRAAKLRIRTAKNLHEGKGIPQKTPYYPNIYGEPLVKPEAVKGIKLDPATSMVTAGFYLFGPYWLEIYSKIEVRTNGVDHASCRVTSGGRTTF